MAFWHIFASRQISHLSNSSLDILGIKPKFFFFFFLEFAHSRGLIYYANLKIQQHKKKKKMHSY